MKLYYGKWGNTDNYVGDFSNMNDIRKHIYNFLQGCNFKSYYQRYILEEDMVIIDFGSHSYFFMITEMNDENMRGIFGKESTNDKTL